MMHPRRDSSVGRLLLAGCLLALTICGTSAWAAEGPIGVWTLVSNPGGPEESTATLTIAEDGGALTASVAGEGGGMETSDPSFEDGVLKFSVTVDVQGQQITFNFVGKVDGDSVEGNWLSDIGTFPVIGTRGGGASPVGEWTLVSNVNGAESESTLTITEAKGSISGSIASDLGVLDITNPSFQDGLLKFDIIIDAQGQEFALGFEGKIDGNSMQGTWTSEYGDIQSTGIRAGADDGATPIIGTWNLQTTSDLGTNDRKLVVNKDLSGTYGGGDLGEFAISNVKSSGNEIEFDFTLEAQGMELPCHVTASIDGSSIEGTLDFGMGQATFTGERAGS